MIDEGLLVARLFLGIPFVIWGYLKLKGGDAKLVPVLSALHLPDAKFLAVMIGVCELAGGIMVVIGYPAQIAGLLLGLWCLITGLIGHKGDINQQLAHATMAGGFFLLAIVGPGALSLFGAHPAGIFGYLK